MKSISSQAKVVILPLCILLNTNQFKANIKEASLAICNTSPVSFLFLINIPTCCNSSALQFCSLHSAQKGLLLNCFNRNPTLMKSSDPVVHAIHIIFNLQKCFFYRIHILVFIIYPPSSFTPLAVMSSKILSSS